jgi:hypothetical protein
MNLAEEIRQYFQARNSRVMTRSIAAPYHHIKELIEYQRALLPAYCTAWHLYYLLTDSGNCYNYFLEDSTDKFQIINWNSIEILTRNKFKTHAVELEDICAFHEVWSPRSCSSEEERMEMMERIFHSEEMRRFEWQGWTLCNDWTESLFDDEEFVINFNRAARVTISADLDHMSLYDEEGGIIKEYGNNYVLFSS